MEERINELIESYREDMIRSLEDLVKIPSVIDPDSAGEGKPFGAEVRKALDAVLKLAEELGFDTKDYDGYAEKRLASCPISMWYRLEMGGSKNPLHRRSVPERCTDAGP